MTGEYYGKRGYKVVEWRDSTQPNYRSVIMLRAKRYSERPRLKQS
jgi:hypothetical protein